MYHLLLYLMGLVLVLSFTVVIFIKRRHGYWKRKGIPHLHPEFFYGNIKLMFKRKISFGEQILQLYKELKEKRVKHGGLYFLHKPIYVPLDLDIIKHILVKDFDVFMDRGMYVNEESDPLSGHLFNLEGEKWKTLRAKLTPTFTSGKMKMMFQTFMETTQELIDKLEEYVECREPVEMKDILSRYTTDVIGSCAFGIQCNSLRDPDAEFRRIGRETFKTTGKARLKQLISRNLPTFILRQIRFKLRTQEMEDFFVNAVKDTIEYREKNNIRRKDFIQILIDLGRDATGDPTDMAKGKNSPLLSLNEMAAQCFVFFAAGFDTSSSTMAFALCALAEHQDIQDKLRKEIDRVLEAEDGKFTYDGIAEMKYLDQVVQEVLRKYPPAVAVPRVCRKTYQIPGTNDVLEKGTRVLVPIYGIQMDPDYYENPEKFDPDRFTEENRSKRRPFTWMPFGEGPRICIGLRFGLLQSKIGLAAIIKNYRVTLNEKTQTPVRFDPKEFINTALGGVWLNFEKIY